MSAAELVDRVGQHVSARADAMRYRLGQGFSVGMREAGEGQPHFFFSSADVPVISGEIKKRLPEQAETIVQQADRICRHEFDLLGYRGLDYGREIDWHRDQVHSKIAARKPFYQIGYLNFSEVGDSKITWELNRHQHFVTLAKAYRLTGKDVYVQELLAQWQDWHKSNPYPVGTNWASSLEVAFRALSWLWFYHLLTDCPLVSKEFRSEWLQAVGISGRHMERYLSTYFSPNTHLLGEAVALFFIGTLCPELEPAARWKELGWTIVLKEAEYQVGSDGFHFEQSTYYHVYALDFFLHSWILAARNGISIPTGFDQTVERMLNALCLLSRAGPPPRFGDDDGGRLFDGRRNHVEHLTDPLATGAVLLARGDYKYVARGMREETLWLLGSDGAKQFDELAPVQTLIGSAALTACGIYLMGNGESGEQLVIDAGPQGTATAGHGHADALSIQLNARGRALLIDPGTFEYVGDGPERNEFRGTAAHNTLQVDGQDQASPTGPFSWKDLPKTTTETWINGECFDLWAGSHDGYARLASPVIHRRFVFLLKSRFWLVRDVAEGRGEHRLDLFWHLAPELSQLKPDDLVFRTPDQTAGLGLFTSKESGWEGRMVQGWWSPAYGQKEAATVINFSTVATLPAEFVTLFEPLGPEPVQTGEFSRLKGLQGNASAYCYTSGGEDHCFVFGYGAAWSFGGWESDAEFVYLRFEDGHCRSLILCNGGYLEVGLEKIVASRRKVMTCEIIEVAGRAKVLSSVEDLVASPSSLEKIVLDREMLLMTRRTSVPVETK